MPHSGYRLRHYSCPLRRHSLNGHQVRPNPRDMVSQVYRIRGVGSAEFNSSSLDPLALSEVYARRAAFVRNKGTAVPCIPVFVDEVMDSEEAHLQFVVERLEFAGAFAESLVSSIRSIGGSRPSRIREIS